MKKRGSYNITKNGTCKSENNTLSVEFNPPLPDKKPTKVETVSFLELFKYAEGLEVVLLYTGIIFAVLNGCFLPLIVVVYGEYTTLLVDRNTPNTTISPTYLLPLFNGGRQTDGTKEDFARAVREDAAACGIEFAILAVLQFLISFAAVASLNYSAVLQTSKLRRAFLKAILRQDISWYDTNNVSTLSSKLVEDLNRVQEGIGEKIGIFITLVMSFITSVVMSFTYGWKLTLVMLTFVPIIVASNAWVTKVQTRLTTLEMEAYGKAGSVAEEVFSSIKTVMAFSGQEKEIQRYHNELEYSVKTGIRRGLLSGVSSGMMWFSIYVSYTVAFWYGTNLIIESREANNFDYTPAVLVIVFFGVLASSLNLGQSFPHMDTFAMARGAAFSVFSILERKPKIDSLSTEGKVLSNVKGEINFKNVHFRYPARPEVEVLRGVNLEIKSGEIVALVGASGCGKSTVIQLVQRLYDPSKGSVSIDGVNLTELNVNSLRRQFGVVGQEPSLFATTIYENIKYGVDSATKEDVEEAAKQANAHEFIIKLPKGYQTVLGAKGSQVSGGQKQRLAIARALIRNPKILLLDEATSALDADNEAKVQEALDKASKGRTTLVVTHKLSTIINADRIVVISEGQVVEEGNHEQLVRLKGHYFKLLEMQKANEKDASEAQENGTAEIITSDMSLSTIRPRASVISTKEYNPEQEDDPVAEEKPTPTSMRRILSYNKPEWWAIAIGAISTFLVGSSVPLFAVLFGEIYGVLSEADSEAVSASVNHYSGVFMALGITAGTATFLQLYLINYAGVKLTSRLRKLVFKAIINQEPGWFDDQRHRSGALCARLSTNASEIQGASGSRIGVIIHSTSTLFLGVVIGFFYSWKLTLVTILAAPIVFFGLYFEGKLIEGRSLLQKKAIEEATKVSVEAISNIRTVASLGREKTFIDRYNEELLSGEQEMKLKSYIRGMVYGLGTTSPLVGYAISLWYGGNLVADEELHFKNVIKVTEAILFGMWVLGQTLAFAPNFTEAKVSAALLFQILDRTPKLKDGEDEKDEGWNADGTVDFSEVEFAYPTRPEMQILKGLSLNIQKGQSIALVGPSGCGKSTVIQLLQRMYDPSSGKIYLDSTAISSLQISTLRRQIGIVSQEPVLFDRTIAENIAYGDNSRKVPEADIILSAKRANIHDFIVNLPLGYNTRVGPGGTQLSGGQKQRIAIARALIRNPKILLLDEATSALDAESESVVQAALDSAASGRTTITVGHRLGAIKRADVIYHLDKGRVKQRGTHEEMFGNKQQHQAEDAG